MADPKRVAMALQYQQDKPDWWDAVPVADAPGTQRTPQTLPMSWLDRLNNFSAGLGTGITNQLEGYKQMVTHPVQSAKDVAQAVGTMATNPAVIVDALKGISAKAASGSQGLGEVIGENMTLNPRRLAMALSHPSINELTVYHGSPHTFEKFDASKIGTGEGAQQYGHGIYVAESPDVAKKYKTANELTETLVNGKAIDPSDPRFQAAVRITTHGYEDALNGALRDASNEFLTPTGKQNQIKLAEQIKQLKDQNVSSRKTGSMYTVDLPDEHIDRMLDWHKPLGQQPKAIRDAINKTKELLPANAMSDLGNDLSVLYGKDVTPNEFLNTWEALTGSIGSGEAALQKNGIPGIKYFDAGSRDVGNGTRNFVIFPGEEHNLKILERK